MDTAPPEPAVIWDRYSSAVLWAIYVAQERAAASGVREITPEHLLVGLLAKSDAIPSWLLRARGVPIEPMQRGLAALPLRDGSAIRGERLGKATLDVLLLAEWEARQRQHVKVGSAHVLLALTLLPGLVSVLLERCAVSHTALAIWLQSRSRAEAQDEVYGEWDPRSFVPAHGPPNPARVMGQPKPTRHAEFNIVRRVLGVWLVARGLTGLAQIMMVANGLANLGPRSPTHRIPVGR